MRWVLLLLLTTAAHADERATEDRPDDQAGAWQVHVLYVVPKGSIGGLDTDGTLARSVSAFNGWLALQTGGPRLRFDTFKGALDVTYVQLDASERDLAVGAGAGGPARLRDRLEQALAPRFHDPHKLYLVFYDGLGLGACGGAPYPPTIPGHVTAQYVGGVFATGYLLHAVAAGATQLTIESLRAPATPYPARLGDENVTVKHAAGGRISLASPLAADHVAGDILVPDHRPPDCRANPFSPDGRALGYREYSALHETLHALGIVAAVAPDLAPAPVAPGHLAGDPHDLMYQGSEAWGCAVAGAKCILDPGHRDYFRLAAGAEGGVDLARSVFLDPTPPDAVPPPGWPQ